MNEGSKIYDLCKKLWPITRSIAGPGNLKTLKILKQINRNLKVKSYKSGKKIFDWKVPNEWIIKNAFIKDEKNRKILDYKSNNLHIVNYSTPIKKKILLKDLKKKIYFLKKLPRAIPYVTSYYKKDWGFCMSFNQFKELKDKKYKVQIESYFKRGKMHFGEIFIRGKSKKEILISTYICHPSMANNELSGPCLSIFLSKWIQKKKRRYSYRFLFITETIGAISYIHQNKIKLKKNIISGLVVTCVGDNNSYSFLASRKGNGILDKIILEELKKNKIKYKKYDWLQRGSDERQYCWPNLDLSVSSLMRSKYHTFKEYHTSLDNLQMVSSLGFNKSLKIYKKIILNLETQYFPISTTLCEPMMSKFGLYPELGNFYKQKKNKIKSKKYLNLLSFSDGKNSINEIAKINNISSNACLLLFKFLQKKKLVNLL
jgi:aminopeptidase-like protein